MSNQTSTRKPNGTTAETRRLPNGINQTVIETVYTSPYARDEEAEGYGKDGFWQNEIIKQAIYQHTGPADGNSYQDMRGRGFAVSVSEDGLTVTIIEARNETP